jgi:hypothetical protein
MELYIHRVLYLYDTTLGKVQRSICNAPLIDGVGDTNSKSQEAAQPPKATKIWHLSIRWLELRVCLCCGASTRVLSFLVAPGLPAYLRLTTWRRFINPHPESIAAYQPITDALIPHTTHATLTFVTNADHNILSQL